MIGSKLTTLMLSMLWIFSTAAQDLDEYYHGRMGNYWADGLYETINHFTYDFGRVEPTFYEVKPRPDGSLSIRKYFPGQRRMPGILVYNGAVYVGGRITGTKNYKPLQGEPGRTYQFGRFENMHQSRGEILIYDVTFIILEQKTRYIYVYRASELSGFLSEYPDLNERWSQASKRDAALFNAIMREINERKEG